MDSGASSPQRVTDDGDHGSRTLTNFPTLAEILSYSRCHGDLTPPVFQNKWHTGGDLVCSDCFKKKDLAPDHWGPKSRSCSEYFRDYAIEKILDGVQVSCKNADLGCTTMYSFMTRTEHEEEDCEYVEALKCSWPGCNEVCKSDDAEDEHLKSTHNVNYRVNADEGRFAVCPGDERVLVKFVSANFFLILHQKTTPLGRPFYFASLQESPSSI